MTDDLIPNFKFDEAEIAAIKASLGTVDVDETQEPFVNETRPKRKPGRPPKVARAAVDSVESGDFTTPTFKSPAIPLTKRDEKDVAKRLANILGGLTGIGGIVKPYVPMTDEEAEAIAEPLASYLVRNEATSGIAREILDNYDLIAVALGVGSYSVRVYSDRKQELAAKRPDNTKAIQRISENQSPDNGRGPDEGISPFISIPDATRSGSAPFDV